jgi:hypothetical protein
VREDARTLKHPEIPALGKQLVDNRRPEKAASSEDA